MARLMEPTAPVPPTPNPAVPKFPSPESLFFSGFSAGRPPSGDANLKLPNPRASFHAGATPPSPTTPSSPQFPPLAGLHVDPKLYPLVARVAAYYQHRCEAIVGFQQQRCMAWANMQRQKYLDMMNGSKLVVAWYIRDRIQRKRRHRRRKFNAGLRDRATQGKKANQDSTTRWVSGISDISVPPDQLAAGSLQDEEEANFSLDVCKPVDQEAKMFQTVDTLIRSQAKKIELPVLGVLDLSESDNESEGSSAQSEDGAMDFDDTTGEDFYDSEEDNKKFVTSAKES
jgi:hypothetical protein